MIHGDKISLICGMRIRDFLAKPAAHYLETIRRKPYSVNDSLKNLTTESILWNFSSKMHFGNLVNQPCCCALKPWVIAGQIYDKNHRNCEVCMGAFSFILEQFFITQLEINGNKIQCDMFLTFSALKIYADTVIKKCLQQLTQCTMLFSKYLSKLQSHKHHRHYSWLIHSFSKLEKEGTSL